MWWYVHLAARQNENKNAIVFPWAPPHWGCPRHYFPLLLCYFSFFPVISPSSVISFLQPLKQKVVTSNSQLLFYICLSGPDLSSQVTEEVTYLQYVFRSLRTTLACTLWATFILSKWACSLQCPMPNMKMVVCCFFYQIYNGIIWVNTVCSLAPCVFVHDWWSLILLAQAHLDHDSQASFSCCALRSWKPATKDLCQPLVVSSYYATVVCVSSRHLAFISAHVTNHCDSLPSHGTFWTRLDESQLLPPVACLSQPSQLQLAAKAPSGIIFLFPHSIFTLAVVWNPQTLG